MSITSSPASDKPRRYTPPVNELIAALYLARGWTPIAVKPRGKTPLVEWRTYQSRQPTPAEIHEWFTSWPDANVGIVTGAVSGLVVVDLDSEDAVREFVRRLGGATLDTPVVRTGRGVQVYFRHPGRPVQNRTGVLPGMDIRGDGGFVVAPGSVHESGERYRFLFETGTAEPAPMPPWLVELLLDTRQPQSSTPGTEHTTIPEGERNTTLYRLARALKARGLSEPAILAAVQAENEARCRPPLPEAELAALVQNALRQPDRADFFERRTEHFEADPPAADADPIAAALQGVFNTRQLDTVEAETVSWLWPDYIPRGKLTLLVGDPKTGKSYLTHDLVARLTSGKVWPDGAPAVAPARVLLLQAEDGLGDTVRPRIDALGGNLSMVTAIESVPTGGKSERLVSLKEDVELLRPVLSTGLVGLLIIDPLTAYLGEGTDSYRDSDVRRILAPLAKLAADTGVAVVAVMHLTKNTDRKSLHRTGGSVAFVAAARTVLAVARDRDDEERRLLLPIASNLGKKPSSLAFRIDEDWRLAWEGPVEVDVEAALGGGAAAASQSAPKLHEAMAFLRAELSAGPRPSDEVKRAWVALGDGHSISTLEKATRRLRVQTTARPGGGWLWSLPHDEEATLTQEKKKESFFFTPDTQDPWADATKRRDAA